jgi:hypothetical protein
MPVVGPDTRTTTREVRAARVAATARRRASGAAGRSRERGREVHGGAVLGREVLDREAQDRGDHDREAQDRGDHDREKRESGDGEEDHGTCEVVNGSLPSSPEATAATRMSTSMTTTQANDQREGRIQCTNASSKQRRPTDGGGRTRECCYPEP